MEFGRQGGVDGDCLPCKPADAVGDCCRRDLQNARGIPDSGGGKEMGEDCSAGKFSLCKKIDAEGLGREACTAVFAVETLDFSKEAGLVAAVFLHTNR